MSALVDLTGMRFGRLTVVRFSGSHKQERRWECVCDCGKAHVVRTASLRSGETKSCGCLHRELVSARMATHRMRGTPTWQSWNAMLKRCREKTHAMSKHYLDRGITVCERWLKFENFLADMGERPAGTTLDRINNDGHYEPGNCRWSTAQEQRRNRRDTVLYTYAGKTMCLTDWIREITGDPKRKLQHSAASLQKAVH